MGDANLHHLQVEAVDQGLSESFTKALGCAVLIQALCETQRTWFLLMVASGIEVHKCTNHPAGPE